MCRIASHRIASKAKHTRNMAASGSDLDGAAHALSGVVEDVLHDAAKSGAGSGPKTFVESVEAFLAAINWRER